VGSAPIPATTEASSGGVPVPVGRAECGVRSPCSTPILATTEASSGGVPVLVGRGKCGMLPNELASVEAWICPLQSPCARPAPRRACLGGSLDLSTTGPLRPPRSPPSLPRWKRGSVHYRALAPAPAPHRACLGGSWDL
jgi:hypothetical protein